MVKMIIEPFMMQFVEEHKGKMNAEQGKELRTCNFAKNESMFGLMRSIKQLIDPNGIMNPYLNNLKKE